MAPEAGQLLCDSTGFAPCRGAMHDYFIAPSAARTVAIRHRTRSRAGYERSQARRAVGPLNESPFVFDNVKTIFFSETRALDFDAISAVESRACEGIVRRPWCGWMSDG